MNKLQNPVSVAIKLKNGTTYTVEAEVVGPYIIHRTLKLGAKNSVSLYKRYYSLSHAKSTMLVTNKKTSVDKLRTLAVLLRFNLNLERVTNPFAPEITREQCDIGRKTYETVFGDIPRSS